MLLLHPRVLGLQDRPAAGIVAASTFGTVGSEWITGVAVALANIVWYTVAIDFAVDSTLRGLESCGLSVAESPSVWELAPFVVVFKSPEYLATAALLDLHHGNVGPLENPRSGRRSHEGLFTRCALAL